MSTERVPKPVRAYHLIALVLLGAFFAQCAWFIYSVPLTQLEAEQILRGVAVLRHLPSTVEAQAPPLVPLLSVLGIVWHLPQDAGFLDQFWLDQHRWFIRAPFLVAGLLLAVSVWYVARRLYGTAAGHIALALLAFSPGMVACSSLAGPQILAAWGSFGLIFTAIATAHTLYAPREVVLWNWKRISLLGVAITLAAGAQWTLAWLLLPAALFMLWAVPHRRGAALLILLAACTVSLVLMDALYLASPAALAHGIGHAGWLHLQAPLIPRLPRMLGSFYFDASPGALLLLACALPAYALWPRSRFFGNTAPLLVFVMLLLLGVLMPQSGASVALFASLPFLLLFVAGVFADLLERKLQAPALAVAMAVIAAQAAYSIASLARMYSRLPGS
jgi:hypothetical protein